VGKKNKEIVKREIDHQELKRQHDQAENSRKNLLKEVQSGKHAQTQRIFDI
jgi:hypothetical protein